MIKVDHEIDFVKEVTCKQGEPPSNDITEEQRELDIALLRLGLQDEISIRDLSESEGEEERNQVFYDASDELESTDDDLAGKLEKRLQLRDNTEVILPPKNWTKQNKQHRRKKQGCTKGQRNREMPRVKDKTTYLRLVNATDCIKDQITGCYLTQKTQRETRSRKAQSMKGTLEEQSQQNPTKMKQKEPIMTRLERKQKYKEQKRILQELWTTDMENSSENEEGISVPSHFKRYTIKECKVVVQQPIQTQRAPGESYDGPEG